jgi:hypothetical protein
LICTIKFWRERTSPTETACIQMDLLCEDFFFNENPHLWRNRRLSRLKIRDLTKYTGKYTSNEKKRRIE